jgi:hypothetical protein
MCFDYGEFFFIYYRKWLKNTCIRGKKKTEIKIYNSPSKKTPSSFTRGEINAKCKERKICAMKSCDGNPAVEDLNNSNTRQN